MMQFFNCFLDQLAQFERMGNAEDFKKLLAFGIFYSYENCLYLCGACRVGKSTFASVLLDEEIPKSWISTDGLNIYFGRNGIDLMRRIMVPLKKGMLIFNYAHKRTNVPKRCNCLSSSTSAVNNKVSIPLFYITFFCVLSSTKKSCLSMFVETEVLFTGGGT